MVCEPKMAFYDTHYLIIDKKRGAVTVWEWVTEGRGARINLDKRRIKFLYQNV